MAELYQRALSVLARCQQPHEETEVSDKSSVPICSYFLTERGCMRGDACWYRHVTPSASIVARPRPSSSPEDDGVWEETNSRRGSSQDTDSRTGSSDDDLDVSALAEARAVTETVSAELAAIEATQSAVCASRRLRAAEASRWREPAPVSRRRQSLCTPAQKADVELVAISSSEDGDDPPRWRPTSSDDDDASKSTTDTLQDEEVRIVGEKLDPSRRRKRLPCQQMYVLPTRRPRTGHNALDVSDLLQRGVRSSVDQRRRKGKPVRSRGTT